MLSPTVKLIPYFISQTKVFSVKPRTLKSIVLSYRLFFFYQVTLKMLERCQQGVAESRVQKLLFSSYINNR